MEAHDPIPDDPFLAFRRDHARVLERLERLDREVLGGPGQVDEEPLRELVAHLERQFATHMTAEDRVLYPALRAAFPEARGTLDPLLADHAELRQMLAALGTLLGREGSGQRDEQIAVLARDLSDLLRLHIRHEESLVLDVAARVLSRTELEAMAVGLDAWRNDSPNPRAPEGR
jgi:hemerythrin-like domain-containing protein